jgi:hypothetical protein
MSCVYASQTEDDTSVILVEFLAKGIDWRKCIFGTMSPDSKLLKIDFPPDEVATIADDILTAFTNEMSGGMPHLSLTLLVGNSLIPPLGGLSIVEYETRQESVISKDKLGSNLTTAKEWFDTTMEGHELDQPDELRPPIILDDDDDYDLGAFEDWDIDE